MTTERAVLAGRCFWGCRSFFADTTAFSRRGSDTRAAACPTLPTAITAHMPKQSRSSLILRGSAIGRSSSFSSKFTTQARAIARATTSGPAIVRRSSTPATSRGGLPKTRSLTSMLQACGPTRLLLKSFQQATSGRPNPSIRTTSNDIPAATPAISSGQTGGCRFAQTRLLGKRERRSRFHPLGETSCEQARALDFPVIPHHTAKKGCC